jgi:DNA (cytosine-5)-methyltransferase 1
VIVDLFAGPGGWDVALRDFGLESTGLEHDPIVCETRWAAGHSTKLTDLSEGYVAWPSGNVEGIVASPPCQDYSVAGMRTGVTGGVEARTKDRGRLVDLVPEWVAVNRPRWVVCEQVPVVLPIWKEHAQRYRQLGYRTWVGRLNAADYGLPQARIRAFLIACRDRSPFPPRPTHAEQTEDSLFGSKQPWVPLIDGIDRRADADAWIKERLHNQKGGGDVDGRWVLTRPSTTIAGRALAQHPGQTTSRFNPAVKTRNDGMKLTEAEGLMLQGFPADYPIAGTNKRVRWSQIGNAVPPPMARIVLESVL